MPALLHPVAMGFPGSSGPGLPWPRPFAEGAAGEAKAAVPDHGEQVVLDFPCLAPVGKTAHQAGGEAELVIDHLEQDGVAMLPTTKGITWRRWRGSNCARRRETEKPLPIPIGSLALGRVPKCDSMVACQATGVGRTAGITSRFTSSGSRGSGKRSSSARRSSASAICSGRSRWDMNRRFSPGRWHATMSSF